MLKDDLIHLTDKNDEIPLQIGLNKRVIRMFKDKQRGKKLWKNSAHLDLKHIHI